MRTLIFPISPSLFINFLYFSVLYLNAPLVDSTVDREDFSQRRTLPPDGTPERRDGPVK